MTAISISTNLQAALEVAQYIRNGKAPTSDIQNQLSTMAGYAAYVQSKQIFRSAGQLCSGGSSLVLSSLATRPRWRFAFHTGPYAWYLMARFEIAPQDNGTPTDPYCELRIYNTSGTQVGVCTIHGGSSSGTYADVPINMTGGVGLVLDPNDLTAMAPLTADTEYTGVFWDVGYARLQSASCWEVSLNPDTDNGYAPNNLGSGGPIYSSHRNDVAAMARLLHKRSGTPVFHWCSNVDSAAPTNAGATSEANVSTSLDALTVSSTGTLAGSGAVDTTLGALTISSTGTTSTFDAVPALVGASLPGQFKISATATGTAQNNGYVYVGFYTNDTLSFSTINMDGWTESGWALTTGNTVQGVNHDTYYFSDFSGPPKYYNVLTRTSVSTGTTAPTWSVSGGTTGQVYQIYSFLYEPPRVVQPFTDECSGGGASLSSAWA